MKSELLGDVLVNSVWEQVAAAVFIGIGATLVMDIWVLMLQRLFAIKSLDFCLVGRWFSHMLLGTFAHSKIAAAQPRPAECAIGWSAHYLIGIAYALVLVMPQFGNWVAQPALLPALLLGAATLLFPFLLMQPALGFGIAAANTPRPGAARLKSLLNHLVFGAGLYLSAVLLNALLNRLG